MAGSSFMFANVGRCRAAVVIEKCRVGRGMEWLAEEGPLVGGVDPAVRFASLRGVEMVLMEMSVLDLYNVWECPEDDIMDGKSFQN